MSFRQSQCAPHTHKQVNILVSSSPGCSLSLLSVPALLYLLSTPQDQAGLAPPAGEENHQNKGGRSVKMRSKTRTEFDCLPDPLSPLVNLEPA